MIQQTLVLIKPDAVKRHLIGEIIKRFEDGGLEVEAVEMVQATQEIIDKHYPLNDRDYILSLGHVDIGGLTGEDLEKLYQKNYKIVQALQEYVMEEPLVKMILSGPGNTIEKVRQIVGKTDPGVSPKGTIRGDLGIDSFAVSDKENRSVRNLVHASGNPEEAKREINLWFGRRPGN